MKPQTQRCFGCSPLILIHSHLTFSACCSVSFPSDDRIRRKFSTGNLLLHLRSTKKYNHACLSHTNNHNQTEGSESSSEIRKDSTPRRRDVLVTPLIAVGAFILRSAVARADEKAPGSEAAPTKVLEMAPVVKAVEESEGEILNSRIYDATAIGEPMVLGKDSKEKVWDTLMNSRIVYLGEAEQVPVRDDKEVELEIVKNLRKRCLEVERPISLALEAFPCNLQQQLDQFMDRRIDGETLKTFVSHWPSERWQEYEPLLIYCRDNSVRLIACGTPLEVLRTVQAEGIRGLSKANRKTYTPPAGSGFISGFSSISHRSSVDINQTIPFGPSSYLSAQSRVVEDYTMSQIILQEVTKGASAGMVVVVTGASHVIYGSRGTGLPARISRKMQKKNQVVILLDPERQYIRQEGEVPVADFLWYSAARPCKRNCFDRAEIARVMNAAGRRRDALPQDLQNGLDRGLVSPEVLQSFFDLEQYPLLAELTDRFQGFRERLLADPKFLSRLAIEESISITTTLIAQYTRRKENFFEELDYVITDTVRGIVVDFFTVWLPAPTLSFLSTTNDVDIPDSMGALKGFLDSIPDNAFQKNLAGNNWNLSHRVASVLVGGLKLGGVGVISSIGAVASSNILFGIRRLLNPAPVDEQLNRRSPLFKTAAVYGSFLATSANLRYQVIAGLVEHRLSDQFSDQTLLVNLLSFVVRTINSYWGTQQWIDLARYTGLQTRKSDTPNFETPVPPTAAPLSCNTKEDSNTDETNTP